MRRRKAVRRKAMQQRREDAAWNAATERIAAGNPASVRNVVAAYERNKRRLLES